MFIIQLLQIAIPQFAFTFIIGMLFFFYVRKRYIRAIVEVISGKDNPDYDKVNRKLKILGSTIFTLVLIFAFLLVEIYQKQIFALTKENMNIALSLFISILGFTSSFIGGASIAAWLVHDEDYREQQPKSI
jgi:Na+/H+ antiporter NhaD/arsenite permease-like protein